MKKLTETFNKISVVKGDSFEIELSTNLSTGYGWDLQVVSGKASLLTDNIDPPQRGASGEMFIGGESNQHFVFIAEESGQIDIKAEYKRPWEKKPPLKSIDFSIAVRNFAL